MKLLKTIFKSIDVAFSIYSKIPMPRFEWASEDMRYHLCFFPWVGAVIGLLEWLWNYLMTGPLLYAAGENQFLRVGVALAIPLLVTGGFHMDGFLDTMDALHSYQGREKKLEILKDPHVGAFAIICLVIYMLLAFCLVPSVFDRRAIYTGYFAFFMARSLSGISVTYFPSAKKDGMLSTFADTENKRVVGVSLIVQLLLATMLLLWMTKFDMAAVAGIVAMGLSFVYYYSMSKRQFGGITGDLAGFFVTVSELAMVGTAAICTMIMQL